MSSSSMPNRVVGYVKPSIKSKIQQQVANTSITESKIVAEALEQYYAAKIKSSTLSKHHY